MAVVRLFGDSVLRGVVYDPEADRYRLCRDQLALNGAEIRNECRMGATSRNGVDTVRRRLDSITPGTVAVIEYGGNDCNYDWKSIAAHPERAADCAVLPDEYTRNMTTMVTELSRAGARVWISTLLPLAEEKFFRAITKGLSAESVMKWLGYRHRLTEWQRYYSDMAAETAKRMGLPLIDLRGRFGEGRDELFCEDGIHPTEAGHVLVHRIVENELACQM